MRLASLRFFSTNYSEVSRTAVSSIQRILSNSLRFDLTANKLLVLYDLASPLSRFLTETYSRAFPPHPNLTLMDFNSSEPAKVKLFIEENLTRQDLVVCIQTGAFFYSSDYRLRLKLFSREIKNIEHVHLGLVQTSEIGNYVDSLAFDHNDPNTQRLISSLHEKIDKSNSFRIVTGGAKEKRQVLSYETPIEKALLNVGNYSGMKNVGGTFPVGEIFTEPRDLSKVNGEVLVFGFPNLNRLVEIHERPFKLLIRNGEVVGHENAPESFQQVFNLIRENEENVIVRELGIGLNRQMGKRKPVSEATAFERQKGVHLSLGKKHTVYKKQGLKAKKTRFHIDVFLEMEEMYAGEDVIFQGGEFVV